MLTRERYQGLASFTQVLMFAQERTQGWDIATQWLACWLLQYSGELCTFSNWQTLLSSVSKCAPSPSLSLSSSAEFKGSSPWARGGREVGREKERWEECGRDNEKGEGKTVYIRQGFMPSQSWHSTYLITTICYSFPILERKPLETERWNS